jgi:antitoxin MazE
MQTRIQRWGNSLALRIPKAFAVDAHLKTNTRVEVTLKDGQIVLTPVEPSEWTLTQLLAGVNKHNVHREIATGPARGKEVW